MPSHAASVCRTAEMRNHFSGSGDWKVWGRSDGLHKSRQGEKKESSDAYVKVKNAFNLYAQSQHGIFFSLSPTTENSTAQSQQNCQNRNWKWETAFFCLFSPPAFLFHPSSEVKEGASHNTLPAPAGFWLSFHIVSPLLSLKVRHNQHPEALCIIPGTLADHAACFGRALLPFSLAQNKYVRRLTQAGPAGANVMMWCCCSGRGMTVN